MVRELIWPVRVTACKVIENANESPNYTTDYVKGFSHTGQRRAPNTEDTKTRSGQAFAGPFIPRQNRLSGRGDEK